MKSLLKVGTQGIPFNILKRTEYERWFDGLEGYAQRWLRSTGYEGKGLSLIPSEDGSLGQVVLSVDDPYNYFVCGGMVEQLPAGDYCIQGDKALLKMAAFSWGVGGYSFDRYKKVDQPDQQERYLVLPTEDVLTEAECFIQAVSRVRDLINTPASDMMPEHLFEAVVSLASDFDADVTQYIGEELLTEGYPTIHTVGRASAHEPRLVDLRWGDESHPKVTLVGKGVCFDSGGLDIKPAAGMRLMKKDMGGAAQVIGLAHLIMAQGLPVRLRLLIPAVENAIAGNAYRPGDVITTRKGLSVEIDNTDAEGRLILCDALAEADREGPDLLIDFATLTGACRVALGTDLPALFTNDKTVGAELLAAGDRVDDPVWSLPLHSPYKELLRSDVADMVNSASGPHGGGITAALYLQAFVDSNTSWLHFDLMAWNKQKLPGRPVGGEAQGIRAVFEYLRQRFQQKS